MQPEDVPPTAAVLTDGAMLDPIDRLARCLVLGSLLDELTRRFGGYDLHRCPRVPEFDGDLRPILARATTEHWFDPCELLAADARSELRPECRRRQEGGGWERS
jgi:hypothetical protein